VAAQAFLDGKYERPEYISPNNNNDYILNKIRKHNIVIIILPDNEYNIFSIIRIISRILFSFPNVRIGLMVGIGGDTPNR
jgi:hypothetical protein